MSDAAHVLDASALLCVMLGEPGADAVAALMSDAIIGAVNLSEVVAKLQERGVPNAVIDESLDELGLMIIPFDTDHALRAGKLRVVTRGSGLSLGDRACLALAMATGGMAITTDRAWAGLGLEVRVQVVRG